MKNERTPTLWEEEYEDLMRFGFYGVAQWDSLEKAARILRSQNQKHVARWFADKAVKAFTDEDYPIITYDEFMADRERFKEVEVREYKFYLPSTFKNIMSQHLKAFIAEGLTPEMTTAEKSKARIAAREEWNSRILSAWDIPMQAAQDAITAVVDERVKERQSTPEEKAQSEVRERGGAAICVQMRLWDESRN